jgi:hypothetical protein
MSAIAKEKSAGSRCAVAKFLQTCMFASSRIGAPKTRAVMLLAAQYTSSLEIAFAADVMPRELLV